MSNEFSPSQLEHYWILARRMATRWCDEPDAQDVAQEVLLRLIHQTQKPRNDVAWIYVVTRRVCNRMHLAAVRRSSAEECFTATRPGVLSCDLAIEAKGILSRLPPRDRAILDLVIRGVPATEIALLVGCKTRDVGQLVKRARRKALRLRDPYRTP
jgi:RNA polymerase sigma factor (sigma-70 family)